jgi:hypothetical protein
MEVVMPPFLFGPAVKIVLGALGAAAATRWAAREVRRINDDLDRVRQANEASTTHDDRPTLRRDPQTGDWRVS